MSRLKRPEAYQETAEKVYSEISTRILGRVTGWDFATGKSQIEALRRFFQESVNDLGDGPFLLELTQQDDSAGDEMTAAIVADVNSSDPAIIRLGSGLRIIEVVSAGIAGDSDLNEVKAADLSQGKVIVFYEQQTLVRFFADQRPAGAIDPRALSSEPGRYSRFARRAEHYEDSILDHYRARVRNWRTDHWADPRQKRKLRARLGRASRTEDIFQNDLLQWFDLFLNASVKGKVGQVSSDETDIEITAPGKLYIVEIKWLGENESGTPYRIERVAEGFRQVRDYLAKQKKAKRATLLVYDGRSEGDFEKLEHLIDQPDAGCKCVCECEGEHVAPRGSCMILFLRSTTASEL